MADWTIDTAHSAVNFSVRHMMFGKTRGQFNRWQGQLTLVPEELAKSSVEVSIDAASIVTGDEQRDNHLRSADFLDVAKFPTLTFRSTRVEDFGEGKLRIWGDLTIHGATKSVVLEAEYGGQVKDPWGNTRAGFSARTSIDRTDFGLKWNLALEAGGIVVGNKVEIEIEVETVQAAAKAA
ncbi:MAG TPA: YceI family protein [Myxococcales bacterium]|nr:YceI family protein [Myxococcales bacterium]